MRFSNSWVAQKLTDGSSRLSPSTDGSSISPMGLPIQRYRILLRQPKLVDGQAYQIKFWPIEIKETGAGFQKGIEFLLGNWEMVANGVRYDDTERMNGRWEEQVQDGLHERGDLLTDEGIMLFRLPPNNRNVEYVAYPTSCVEVI